MIDGKQYFEIRLPELIALAESGQTDEAIAILDTLEANLARISPESQDWFTRSIAAQRGETYASGLRPDLALAAYSKAQSKLHENYPQNQHAMANIYATMGRYFDSLDALDKGLQVAATLESSYVLELLVAYVGYGSKVGRMPPIDYSHALATACQARGITFSKQPETTTEFIEQIENAWSIYKTISTNKSKRFKKGGQHQ